jgi:rod shape-determining protein MreC
MNSRTWIRIRDWSLLSLLLILSVAIMLNLNTPVMRAVRGLALQATANIEQLFAGGARYLRALEENAALREQNMTLSSRVARMREAQIENERLRNLLDLRQRSDYQFVAARIISMDITRQQNHCIIDVGTSDGIARGMPVVNQDGILGRIILANENYSIVQTYLHTDFRISAMVSPLQSIGIVGWDGQNPNKLILEHVVKTEDVESGQQVVTSGYSNVYPRGLPIGVVDSVQLRSGRNELLIAVTPAAEIHRAHHAFVLLKEQDSEYKNLEEQVTQ